MATEPSWPLLLRVLWSGMNVLPRFVLRRKYPAEVVARNFNVDLESTRATELSFGSSIPHFRVRLRYVKGPRRYWRRHAEVSLPHLIAAATPKKQRS